MTLTFLERHPLGSQAFVPLQDRPWLVLVAGDVHEISSYRAFTATGRQGVNYARNVWHHPLLVMDADSRFLAVNRPFADACGRPSPSTSPSTWSGA